MNKAFPLNTASVCIATSLLLCLFGGGCVTPPASEFSRAPTYDYTIKFSAPLPAAAKIYIDGIEKSSLPKGAEEYSFDGDFIDYETGRMVAVSLKFGDNIPYFCETYLHLQVGQDPRNFRVIVHKLPIPSFAMEAGLPTDGGKCFAGDTLTLNAYDASGAPPPVFLVCL